MEHQEEKEINTTGLYYLIGAVFGALTGAYCAESFLGFVGGLVFGLIFAAFFVNALVKGRNEEEHA